MRALVLRLTADGRREKVLVSNWPTPAEPTGTHIKVQTLYTGLTNGTERNQLIRGNYAPPDEKLPLTSGYQIVGRVVAAGPAVQTVQIGDIVYIGEHLGHIEFAVTAEDGLVVKLPENVDPKVAAFFGMGSVALNTCCHANLSMGERLLVVGAGCVGQIVAQIAASMGARVTIADIMEDRLALAQQIGAVETALNVAGDGWAQGITDGAFDAVVDVAGAPGMEDQLIRALRRRGRLLFIAGRGQVVYTFNLGQGREVTIKQNSHFDRDDLHNFCRLVSRRLVRLEPLIREVAPASEAKRVYDTLRDQPEVLLGTVFEW